VHSLSLSLSLSVLCVDDSEDFSVAPSPVKRTTKRRLPLLTASDLQASLEQQQQVIEFFKRFNDSRRLSSFVRGYNRYRNCSCHSDPQQLHLLRDYQTPMQVLQSAELHEKQRNTKTEAAAQHVPNAEKHKQAVGLKDGKLLKKATIRHQFASVWLCLKCFNLLQGIGRSTYFKAKKLVVDADGSVMEAKKQLQERKEKKAKRQPVLTLATAAVLKARSRQLGGGNPNEMVGDEATTDMNECKARELADALRLEGWIDVSVRTVWRALALVPELKLRHAKAMGGCKWCRTIDYAMSHATSKAHMQQVMQSIASILNVQCPTDVHSDQWEVVSRRLLRELKGRHLARAALQSKEWESKVSRSVLQPDEYHVVSIDGLDKAKTKLPNVSRRYRVKDAAGTPVSFHVIGALSRSAPCPLFHFLHCLDAYPSSGNITAYVILLWVAFRRGILHSPQQLAPSIAFPVPLSEFPRHGGYATACRARRLDVGLDSAPDNKTAVVMRVMMLLVLLDVYEESYIYSKVVGHTRGDVDQTFAPVARELEWRDVFTLDELLQMLPGCWHPMEEDVELKAKQEIVKLHIKRAAAVKEKEEAEREGKQLHEASEQQHREAMITNEQIAAQLNVTRSTVNRVINFYQEQLEELGEGVSPDDLRLVEPSLLKSGQSSRVGRNRRPVNCLPPQAHFLHAIPDLESFLDSLDLFDDVLQGQFKKEESLRHEFKFYLDELTGHYMMAVRLFKDDIIDFSKLAVRNRSKAYAGATVAASAAVVDVDVDDGQWRDAVVMVRKEKAVKFRELVLCKDRSQLLSLSSGRSAAAAAAERIPDPIVIPPCRLRPKDQLLKDVSALAHNQLSEEHRQSWLRVIEASERAVNSCGEDCAECRRLMMGVISSRFIKMPRNQLAQLSLHASNSNNESVLKDVEIYKAKEKNAKKAKDAMIHHLRTVLSTPPLHAYHRFFVLCSQWLHFFPACERRSNAPPLLPANMTFAEESLLMQMLVPQVVAKNGAFVKKPVQLVDLPGELTLNRSFGPSVMKRGELQCGMLLCCLVGNLDSADSLSVVVGSVIRLEEKDADKSLQLHTSPVRIDAFTDTSAFIHKFVESKKTQTHSAATLYKSAALKPWTAILLSTSSTASNQQQQPARTSTRIQRYQQQQQRNQQQQQKLEMDSCVYLPEGYCFVAIEVENQLWIGLVGDNDWLHVNGDSQSSLNLFWYEPCGNPRRPKKAADAAVGQSTFRAMKTSEGGFSATKKVDKDKEVVGNIVAFFATGEDFSKDETGDMLLMLPKENDECNDDNVPLAAVATQWRLPSVKELEECRKEHLKGKKKSLQRRFTECLNKWFHPAVRERIEQRKRAEYEQRKKQQAEAMAAAFEEPIGSIAVSVTQASSSSSSSTAAASAAAAAASDLQMERRLYCILRGGWRPCNEAVESQIDVHYDAPLDRCVYWCLQENAVKATREHYQLTESFICSTLAYLQQMLPTSKFYVIADQAAEARKKRALAAAEKKLKRPAPAAAPGKAKKARKPESESEEEKKEENA
jgi:hypothetical protein